MLWAKSHCPFKGPIIGCNISGELELQLRINCPDFDSDSDSGMARNFKNAKAAWHTQAGILT